MRILSHQQRLWRLVTGFMLVGFSASAHHAGGAGNALSAGPIVTISATTIEQGHGIAVVSVDYQSLRGLSDNTLIEATANQPPGTPEENHVHDLRSGQAYALLYAYGVTEDLSLSDYPLFGAPAFAKPMSTSRVSSRSRTLDHPMESAISCCLASTAFCGRRRTSWRFCSGSRRQRERPTT
jgi:hypothetical protein